MKNDKLIPGVILVLIGAAFLLSNFHVLHFHWYNIFHLWPIFLVIAGVNLVFAHNKSTWATILKIAVVVGGFGLLLFGNFENRFSFWPGFHYGYHNGNNDNYDDNGDDNSDSTAVQANATGTFNEPFAAGTHFAVLNISGGGTTYRLNDTTNQLFSADTKQSNGAYEFTHHQDSAAYVIDFHLKNHKGFNFDSDKNSAVLKLNLLPEWEVNVKAGATDLNFDLSKFKIRKFRIDGGAASFNVKFGAPLAETNIDISTGVSGVDLQIPQNAACSITINSGLSDNQFDGFTKINGNTYQTTGFDAAKNKFYVHMSGGLSDFKVRRY